MSILSQYACLIPFFVICFEIKLKLGEAALKIEVNPSAVELSSSSEARIYACLQEHITKLQVFFVKLHHLICITKRICTVRFEFMNIARLLLIFLCN